MHQTIEEARAALNEARLDVVGDFGEEAYEQGANDIVRAIAADSTTEVAGELLRQEGVDTVVLGGLTLTVQPQRVPTQAVPFHPRATHIDALGMPVAYGERDYGDGHPVERWTWLPTPCCGAAASISDGPMYCKACYREVDPAFGNVPVEPIRLLSEVVR